LNRSGTVTDPARRRSTACNCQIGNSPRSDGRLKGLALEGELAKRGATPWCGVVVIDTRSGGIVQWVRFTEGVEELFGVAAIPDVRCPRGVSPNVGELQEVMTYEPISV
jgi:hypothetical protein